MRFRSIFVGLGSLVVLLVVFFSDPSVGLISQLPIGSGTVGVIVNMLISVWYVALLHYCRKGLFDYIDLEVFFKKSMETAEGSGMALISVAIAMVSIALVIVAASIK